MIVGYVAASGYIMKGQTDRATETTSNNGIGNPVIHTGMVRTLRRKLFLLDTLKRNRRSGNRGAVCF